MSLNSPLSVHHIAFAAMNKLLSANPFGSSAPKVSRLVDCSVQRISVQHSDSTTQSSKASAVSATKQQSSQHHMLQLHHRVESMNSHAMLFSASISTVDTKQSFRTDLHANRCLRFISSSEHRAHKLATTDNNSADSSNCNSIESRNANRAAPPSIHIVRSPFDDAAYRLRR